MKITSASLHSIPLPLPQSKRGRVSLNQPGTARHPATPAAHALVAELETDVGLRGRGYTLHYGVGTAAILQLAAEEIAPLFLGEDAFATERLLAKAEFRFRDLGFQGLVSRGYAPFDIACWDLKSQQAGCSPAALLGAAKAGASFFTSDIPGTAWSVLDAVEAAKTTRRAGGLGIRLEIGSAPVEADAERIRELHDAIGEETWLGLSAHGRYDLNTALALAHFFEDQAVDWFEDPVNPSDHAAYARLANKLELPVALGSSLDRREDFYRMIREGLARIVRPDLGKVGGITPFLKIATVAEAFGVSLAPVRLAEITVHLAAALPAVTLVERTTWTQEQFPQAQAHHLEQGHLIPHQSVGFQL